MENNYQAWVDYGTLAVLGVMGFIALFLTIERVLRFKTLEPAQFEEKEALEIEASKNLATIATIGSNAPYVGLLGTVFGIMLTFYAIGQEGLAQTNEVMIGLALALKATALGLVVAIPSMIAYNLLVRKTEVIIAQWEMQQRR